MVNIFTSKIFYNLFRLIIGSKQVNISKPLHTYYSHFAGKGLAFPGVGGLRVLLPAPSIEIKLCFALGFFCWSLTILIGKKIMFRCL